MDELPASMRGLTELQQRFVWAMAMTPGIKQWKAAEVAGYQGGPTVTKVKACELLQQDKIINAIKDMAGKRMQARALQAADFLASSFTDPKLPMALRIRAAESVLDRVGLGSEQNIKVEHTHTDMTGAAMMERIRELAKRHGMDPDKLLAGKEKFPDISRETSREPLLIEGKVDGHDDILGSAQETEAATKDLP